MDNANYVLRVGEKLVKFGKAGLKAGLYAFIGAVVFLLMHYLTEGGFETFLVAFVFDFGMLDGLQAIVVLCIYAGMLWFSVALPLYFLGVHYLGLGQIAVNTGKQKN